MKVVVLGGSAAGPNTGAGCSGYLLVEGETALVIDLGPGTLLELRRHMDFRDLSTILVSHYHLDHILDIGAFRYLGKYNPEPIRRKIDLLVPPGTASRFAAWGGIFGDPSEPEFLEAVFSISEYDPAATSRVGPFEVTMAPTVHPVPAHAMRITDSRGIALGYTADTGPTANLEAFFDGVALLISESTEPAGSHSDAKTRGHLTAAEAARLASDANAGGLILAHRWEESGLEAAALEAKAEFSGLVMVARPGLTVYI